MIHPDLESRLRDLEGELAKGQNRLARLDAEREGLTRQLLRIEGAITLARELSDPPTAVDLAETG